MLFVSITMENHCVPSICSCIIALIGNLNPFVIINFYQKIALYIYATVLLLTPFNCASIQQFLCFSSKLKINAVATNQHSYAAQRDTYFLCVGMRKIKGAVIDQKYWFPTPQNEGNDRQSSSTQKATPQTYHMMLLLWLSVLHYSEGSLTYIFMDNLMGIMYAGACSTTLEHQIRL